MFVAALVATGKNGTKQKFRKVKKECVILRKQRKQSFGIVYNGISFALTKSNV